MAITIGQFLNLRTKNADTPADPYDPKRESYLELNLPEVPVVLSTASPLPPPPGVDLSIPGALPAPPNVALSSPSVLPGPPGVVLSTPAALPPPPGTVQSVPANLPPEPAPPASVPAPLPPPPPATLSVPGALPPPPPTTQSTPGILPPPPATVQSQRAELPEPPPTNQSIPAGLPKPPGAVLSQPLVLPGPPPTKAGGAHEPDPTKVSPLARPGTDYKLLSETYSPVFGASDPGSLAADPILYERQLERGAKLPPGKLAVHALTQVGLFAQNVYGTIWNPALAAPPPILQNTLRPALDLPSGEEGTKEKQLAIRTIVDSALDGTKPNPVTFRFEVEQGQARKQGGEPTVTHLKKKDNLARAFDNVKNVVANGLSLAGVGNVDDPLYKSKLAFENGIIPMRLRGDNSLGFRTFRRSQKDQTPDDSVYVPLCFTDLRPIGDVFRTVYFRPIITSFSENLSPEWNKSQYLGRVDPVATYQSTGRTINLGFKLIAFGPEDVRTIYQKLNWLTSMVYPEYDNNLVYRSGPVVRLRIGDVINANGPEGGRGLPGIIESLDFDYTDALWELKEGYKLPRHVDVSLTFTVLHDVPIGRGLEGQFGGLGVIDDNGVLTVKSGVNTGTGEKAPTVSRDNFRKFGKADDLNYTTLAGADQEKP